MHCELTLVVQQLLSCLGGILDVLCLDNGVNGTRFLAETTVDTLVTQALRQGCAFFCVFTTHLGHVQVVSDGLPASVISSLRLDSDSLGGADGFTELAGYDEVKIDKPVMCSFGIGPATYQYTSPRRWDIFEGHVRHGTAARWVPFRRGT